MLHWETYIHEHDSPVPVTTVYVIRGSGKTKMSVYILLSGPYGLVVIVNWIPTFPVTDPEFNSQ